MCTDDYDTSAYKVVSSGDDITVYSCSNGDIGIKVDNQLVIMPPMKWFKLARNAEMKKSQERREEEDDEFFADLDEVDF